MLDNKSVFVAGASGAVGRRLCPLLVADGWSVYGTTRNREKAELLNKLGVEPVVVDVFDDLALTKLMLEIQPSVVIHQLTDLPAGLDPALMAEATERNARVREFGTRNLISAATAAGVKRFIAQSVAFLYIAGNKPYREDAPLDLDNPKYEVTSHGVASLEGQVLAAPLVGIVLRYGKFYGPGTGFDVAPSNGPVHVDAAADGARRAATHGEAGIYNMAEDDGTIDSRKAIRRLGWDSTFRLQES